MTDDELKALAADPYYVEAGERHISPRTVEVLCAAIPRLLAENRILRNAGVNQAEQIERLLAEKARLLIVLSNVLHIHDTGRTDEDAAEMLRLARALEQGGASAPTGEEG